MFEEIQKHRQAVEENIRKSFQVDLEKGGVYADTYENRKLGRVGQPYAHGGGKTEDAPEGKVARFSDHAMVIHDGKDRFFTTKSPYYTKEEFLKELKSYLKQKGEKLDTSKIKVGRELGYDHYIHRRYYYEIAGSLDGREDDSYVRGQKKLKEWLKTHQTARQLMGNKYSVEKILQNATKEEREILQSRPDDGGVKREETMVKIAKRILGQ